MRFDARFADGSVSYRAFRFELDAQPKGRPATLVVRNRDGSLTLYVSWNGATAVAKWQLMAGPSADRMKPVKTQRRTGFETAISLPATSGYVSVIALDKHGKQLRAAVPTPIQA